MRRNEIHPHNLRSAGPLCALALAGCHLLSHTAHVKNPGVYYGVFVTGNLSSNIIPITNFEGVVGKETMAISERNFPISCRRKLSPYEYCWTVLSTGSHLITAESYDTKGNTITSSIYITGQ